MALSSEYAPQNFYCYSIDKKSPDAFKNRLRSLTSCFPNVFISPVEYDTDSTGKQMNYAYVECLKVLQKYPWNYVVLLQNHDILTKTNYELTQIFRLFCGANDIRTSPPMMERFKENANWTFEALDLLNNPGDYIDGLGLTLAKGQAQSSLSRPFVDFILNELNLTNLMAQLEGEYGIDELLMPMLDVSEELKAPGGFTRSCLEKGIGVNDVTM